MAEFLRLIETRVMDIYILFLKKIKTETAEGILTYTILAADDSKTIRRALQIVFEKEDVKLILMNNGQDAIAQTKNLRPNLVIADHNMPTNGYEVAKAISSDPSCSHIPVLLLVGSSAPYDRAKYDSCGAKGEIRKPFQSASLLKTVYEAIKVNNVEPAAQVAEVPTAARSETIAYNINQVQVNPEDNLPVEGVPTPVLGSLSPTSVMSGAAVQNNLFDAEKARPAISTTQNIEASPMIPAIVEKVEQRVQEKFTAESGTQNISADLTNSQQIKQETRDMIEKIVWEVVPELAETIIKEEIKRLMQT